MPCTITVEVSINNASGYGQGIWKARSGEIRALQNSTQLTLLVFCSCFRLHRALLLYTRRVYRFGCCYFASQSGRRKKDRITCTTHLSSFFKRRLCSGCFASRSRSFQFVRLFTHSLHPRLSTFSIAVSQWCFAAGPVTYRIDIAVPLSFSPKFSNDPSKAYLGNLVPLLFLLRIFPSANLQHIIRNSTYL